MKPASSSTFQIASYKFDQKALQQLEDNLWVKNLWPLVYILSDHKRKEAYIGESANALNRLNNHLRNDQKSKLNNLHLITSDKFNKSATLDIESNLISYMSGDGKYKLLNGNAGIANHNYYQKDEYFDLFKRIWIELKDEDITIQSLKEIDNSDLFKYSPYKTLTNEQYNAVGDILETIVQGNYKSIMVDGSAGTGKTVLAIFLIKLLVTRIDDLFDYEDSIDDINWIAALKRKYPKPKVALVVPMTSLRKTLKNVFRNISGLNAKMVVGPTEITKEKYDILLVDEAHRLKWRKNLTGYGAFDQGNQRLGLDKYEGTALDWVLLQSSHQILFYDADQSIKPSDVRKERFDELRQSAKFIKLTSQLRVKGGTDYINYVNRLLHARMTVAEPIFENEAYELELFESLQPLLDKLAAKEEEHGLSRLVAGFAWEWKSKNTAAIDIEIEGIQLRWNSNNIDWINSENALNEVGCIHTTQGYDLNYTGIIFGKEISYDPHQDEIVIIPEHYHDTKGKSGIKDPSILKAYIINIYKTLMYRGIKGTYVYVCDDNLRAYFKKHLKTHGATTSTLKILAANEVQPYINSVPFYDLQVAAGPFSALQSVDNLEWVELPSPFKASENYFVCQVVGESMNRIIPNGAYCLFKKYSGGSRVGKIVLVQHYNIQEADFGAGYAIKEYHSQKTAHEGTWKHDSIILKAKSNDPTFEDIILEESELESLQVLGVFVSILG